MPRARLLKEKDAKTTPLNLKALKDVLDIGSNGKPLQSAYSFSFAEELSAIRSNPHHLHLQVAPTSSDKSLSDDVHVASGEVVVSFTLHSESQRLQDLDLLGTQTLRDLRDAVFCGLIEKCKNEAIDEGKEERNCFFFIEGSFYADKFPSSTSLPQPSKAQSRARRGCRDGRRRLDTIRMWLLDCKQDVTAMNGDGDGDGDASLADKDHSLDDGDKDTLEGTETEVIAGTGESSTAFHRRVAREIAAFSRAKYTDEQWEQLRQLAIIKGKEMEYGGRQKKQSELPLAKRSKRQRLGEACSTTVSKGTEDQPALSSKRGKRKAATTNKYVKKATAKTTSSSVSWADQGSDSEDSSIHGGKHSNTDNVQTDRRVISLQSQPLLALAPPAGVLQDCTRPVVTSRNSSRNSSNSNNSSSSSSRSSSSSSSSSNSNSSSSSSSRIVKEDLLELNGISTSSALNVLSLDTPIGSLVLRPGVRYLFTNTSGTDSNHEYFLYLTDMHLHSSYKSTANPSNSAGVRANTNISNPTSKDRPTPFRDLPLVSSYPRQTFLIRTVVKKCAVCILWSAQYVVYGDRLADRSPMLYCQCVTLHSYVCFIGPR